MYPHKVNDTSRCTNFRHIHLKKREIIHWYNIHAKHLTYLERTSVEEIDGLDHSLLFGDNLY